MFEFSKLVLKLSLFREIIFKLVLKEYFSAFLRNANTKLKMLDTTLAVKHLCRSLPNSTTFDFSIIFPQSINEANRAKCSSKSEQEEERSTILL